MGVAILGAGFTSSDLDGLPRLRLRFAAGGEKRQDVN
jgi:hypothetical protein